MNNIFDTRVLKSHRLLVIMSLFLALHIILTSFYIPIFDNTRILFTFFIKALVGYLGGPLWAVIFGFTCDILGHLIFPSGGYYFGYTITSILSCFIFALVLYKQEITILRLFISKFIVNIFVNVIVNSYWSYILLSNGYLYYLLQSFIKNIILLPFEVILLVILFKLLNPIFVRIIKERKIYEIY